MEVDKNEAIRGGQSYEELPLRAKSRLVVHGFKDPNALAGKNQDGRTYFAPGSHRSLGTACRLEVLALAPWGR